MKTVLLSVGISQYKHKEITDLRVCAQDAQAVAAAFAQIAGAKLEQRLLLDKQATKQGIQDGIAWLAETAQKGDLAVFYFSGHGASNPDQEGESGEDDRHDEFLCPHDCGVEAGLASFIRDDELRVWLQAVGKKTDQVAIILDSCHSGTANMAPKHAVAKEVPPGVVQALLGGERVPRRTASKSSVVKDQLLLAGCQDDEKSYILPQAAHSAFTANILAGLEDPAIDTFQALYARASAQTAEQTEQLGLQQNPNIVDGTGGGLTFR